MGVSNWIRNFRSRIHERSIRFALVASAIDAFHAIRRRGIAVIYRAIGRGYSTELAGVSVQYLVTNVGDIRRSEDGFGEEPVLDWLLSNANPGEVFWDIGAYHGTYSVLAASKGLTTVAFEPHPKNAERVRTNAKLNNVDIDCREIALSDKNGERYLQTTERGSEHRVVDEGNQAIRTRRGDSIDENPDVVKIDVEGHERAVLDGMSETLLNVRQIVVEVHEGVPVNEVLTKLEKSGLDVYTIPVDREESFVGGIRPAARES